jgi:hypothetical protein
MPGKDRPTGRYNVSRFDRYWPLGMILAAGIAVVLVINPLRSVLALPASEHSLSAILLDHVAIAWWSCVALGFGMFSADSDDQKGCVACRRAATRRCEYGPSAKRT